MKRFLYEIAQDKKKGPVAFSLKPVLYFLSLIYGFCVALLTYSYRKGIFPGYKSKVKVISVGNLTLGGTGKTPFIEFLAARLIARGHKVSVLSRGYSDDESRMLAKNIPQLKILIGKDRVESAKQIEKESEIGCIILDDGFQHWRLKRDMDIVLINSANPFGNKKLIPRGILREPVSALRRAQVVVLTKTDLARNLNLLREHLMAVNPYILLVHAVHKPQCFYDLDGRKIELKQLEGRSVCLLSGIGDPDSFRDTVLNLGIKPGLILNYPDHYSYTKDDMLDVLSKCSGKGINAIVTTEKDLVRLPQDVKWGKIACFVLKIELTITRNEDKLLDRISGVLGS